MALRLGVGDVLTVCKGAVDFCRTIHDEPEEVQTAIAEMKLIRAHLKCLESQIGDEKLFAAARPDIAPVIKRSLEPLHKDLTDMNHILHEFKRKPSVHVVDKVRHLLLYKAKLDAFREKVPAHRESISIMQELIDGQSPSKRRESTAKLCELVESHVQQHQKEDEYDRAQREVVKMFEERHSSIGDDRQLSNTEMLEQLEDSLVAKGISRKQAGQQLFPITKALLLHPLPFTLDRGPAIQKTRQPAFKLDMFECRSSLNEISDVTASMGRTKDDSELD